MVRTDLVDIRYICGCLRVVVGNTLFSSEGAMLIWNIDDCCGRGTLMIVVDVPVISLLILLVQLLCML